MNSRMHDNAIDKIAERDALSCRLSRRLRRRAGSPRSACIHPSGAGADTTWKFSEMTRFRETSEAIWSRFDLSLQERTASNAAVPSNPDPRCILSASKSQFYVRWVSVNKC
jgi:hypothetical protein